MKSNTTRTPDEAERSFAADTPIRIALADDDALNRNRFIRMFRTMGLDLVVAAENGSELVCQCLEKKPDVVITKTTMPDMDGVEAARQIYEKLPVAIIFISDADDPAGHEGGGKLVDRSYSAHGLAYFTSPPSGLELQIAISVSLATFTKLRELEEKTLRLEQKLHEAQTALDDRKTIERAKGIIMKWAGIDEQQAYRRLQKLARDKNRKLIDMATTIVELDKMPNAGRGPIQ